MKFIVAPDSFKGSLSSVEAAAAMEAGIRRVFPVAEIVKLPIADGGEGTLDSILAATGGMKIERLVTGPLGEPIKAAYGVLPDGTTAIVEMAQAAGLHLVEQSQRDPRKTTTYGVGELITAALDQGANSFVIGIGGSSTNDGGAGAMQALGARFLDANGDSIGTYVAGEDLIRLARIDMERFRFPTGKVRVVVASDVINPLVGPNGASAIYGPQKGATIEIVAELDEALTNYAAVIQRDLGVEVANRPGAGAAGGTGAALAAFLNAEMQSGIDLIMDIIGFDKALDDTDFVFTGEGRIDSQTLQGKVIAGVLSRARGRKIPVVAFGGSVDPDAEQTLSSSGLLGCMPIANRCMDLAAAMAAAPELIELAAARTCRLLSQR
jgi:glycerate kinase